MKKRYIRVYKENIIVNKDIARKIRDYKILEKELEPIIKDLKSSVKDDMITLGKDKVVSNGICFSLKNDYDKTSIDTKSLEKDYPNIYKKYAYTSHVDKSIVMSVSD